MRLGFALAVSLATSFASLAASANSAGVAGYSRKPSAFAPQGESCSQCHSGGAAPQVAINGPASLAAGTSAEYTLVVTTGLARAAGGVAATDGVILTPSVNGGFRDSFGEMVQDTPRAPTGGQATFRFRVTAPATGNTLKLWAVGLGANNSGSTAGDGVAHTTRDITVTGGSPGPAPDAGASSSSGGASSSGGEPPPDGSDGGTSGSSGGTSSSSGDPAGDDGDPSTGGAGDDGAGDGAEASPSRKSRTTTTSEPGLACSTVPGLGSSSLVLGAGLGIVLAVAARRRRR